MSDFESTRKRVSSIIEWYKDEGLPSGDIDGLLTKQAEVLSVLDYIGHQIGVYDMARVNADASHDEHYADSWLKVRKDLTNDAGRAPSKEVCDNCAKLAAIGTQKKKETAHAAYRSYSKLYNTSEKLYESMRSAISKLKQEKGRYDEAN